MNDKSPQSSSVVHGSDGIVDIHAHVILPSYNELLISLGFSIPDFGSASAANLPKPPPQHGTMPPAILDTDEALNRRIALMDEAGVTRQILSTTFAPYFSEEEAAVTAARHVNNLHADIVRKHPTRFAAFAALPLPHINASIVELKRCMDELGMVGANIQCFCLDRSVADDHFYPVYDEANHRKAPIFFHPCFNGVCTPLVTEWGLSGTVGNLFEDTLVALHLIIKQVPKRFPDIKFIIPHFGGVMPMFLDRLDNQMALSIPGLPEKPSITARRFWYDTVGHGSKAACNCAIEAFGDRQILPGSDYPFLLPYEGYDRTFAYMRHLGLPEDTVRRILYDNVRDVFGEEMSLLKPLNCA